MSYLNANIPPIYCKIRKEYLYDLDPKYNKESEECVIFGFASITGRAILFHIMLPNGAVYYRLPISRFSKNVFLDPKCPICQLTSYNCGIVLVIILLLLTFDFLGGQRGKFFGKDKGLYSGTYLFTVDWAHPDSNILDTDHS
jgi:hypothetical protein